MTYKIKLFYENEAASENLTRDKMWLSYFGLTKEYGEDKDVYLTCDNDYTHAIIFNTCTPELKPNIPKENVVGIALEPPYFLHITPQFLFYAMKYISRYYIGNRYELPEDIFAEKFVFILYAMPTFTICPPKKNLMSIVLSNKNVAPGHKYRHLMVQRILQMGLPIDIYGRGCSAYANATVPFHKGTGIFNLNHMNVKDPRIKGTFESMEPYESYQFTIAIENFQTEHYLSEKVIHPLLNECIPIYHGCNNIESYLPNVIRMTGNLEEDIILLKKILAKPNDYITKINVEDVKQRMNLLNNLDDIFPKPIIDKETV